MKEILLLYDYKSFFGSKTDAVPYLSGMNIHYIRELFGESGYNCIPMNFADIDFRKYDYKGKYIIYTSSEDTGYHYKDYIEDIILALELNGAVVIPSWQYLRANNNKVFMELIRDMSPLKDLANIRSGHFGTLEDFKKAMPGMEVPAVLKKPRGGMSAGVSLAKNKKELYRQAKKYSRSKNRFREIWELGRSVKYRGYTRESWYRNKFIVQEFIPGLQNDWKVLIYDKKYYVLRRMNRKNDFRASGSGLFEWARELPEGLLDHAAKIFRHMKVPNLSLDIVTDGAQFRTIEFQAVYFGNTTLVKSDHYYQQGDDGWVAVEGSSDLEKEYVNSIVQFIDGGSGQNGYQ